MNTTNFNTCQPLTAAAVADIITPLRYHLGKQPSWLGALSQVEAVGLASIAAARLRRSNPDQPPPSKEQLDLAEQLDSCGPYHYCGRGHCPVCGRAFQRWSVDQILYSSPLGRRCDWVAVSLVHTATHAALGQLSQFDVARFWATVAGAFSHCEVVHQAIIGLDVSFNDLSQRALKSRWQFQAYAICETADRNELREHLIERFPRTQSVPKPVFIKTFDHTPYAASYVLKTEFVQRIAYRDKNTRWNTKKRRLYAYQHIELMHFLAKIGFHNRAAVVGSEIADEWWKIAMG